MKRITAVLSAAAFAMTAAVVFAQAHPSFAGKWARVDDPAAAAAGGPGGGRGGRGGFGQEVTITQDAATITMEWTQGQNTQKRVYKLDGSDSTNTVMARGGEMEQVSKAVWTGNTLVITTAAGNGETKQVLSMAGADLKVEQTNPGRGGGEPTTTTITYKKAM